jgi:predicted kinase
VIATAGLPARGKTHIARKLNRYLNWVGYKSQVFSVAQVMKSLQGVDFDPEIYDPDNEKAVQLREEYSLVAI